MPTEPPLLERRQDPEPGICPLVENGVACRRRVAYRGLCQAHRTRLGELGRFEEFAVRSRLRAHTRIVAKNPRPTPGVCPLLENGAACTRPAQVRGICKAHRNYLKATGQLEELAAPSKQSRKSVFAVDPKAPEGICWIYQDGRSCVRGAGPSGICAIHRSVLFYRPDLRKEDFTRSVKQITYARKKRREPGVCVVRELRPIPGHPLGRFAYCEGRAHARGLCQKHYRRLDPNPALFLAIADPVREKTDYRLKADLKDGLCVVVEDDVGCTLPTKHPRRTCDTHRTRLRTAGLLHELTDRFVKTGWSFERKPENARVPGFCLLVVNGVPCTGESQHRGICHNCYYLVKKHADYEALALPLTEKRAPAFVRRQLLVKGVCALVEDGEPCAETARARGLCRRHYRVAESRGLLDELGLSAEELLKLPEVPHYYLDKNVPIRFAVHEIFGVTPDRSSVALLEAVLKGLVRATVSLDCVRAVYSHVGHRLARPIAEGGRAFDAEAAERLARDYTGKLFFGRGGLFSFMASRAESFRACAFEGQLPGLSLEDALELHLFAEAKREHRAELFVTADTGILKYGEAVHPERVVNAHGQLLQP